VSIVLLVVAFMAAPFLGRDSERPFDTAMILVPLAVLVAFW
jgi:hypothetical protein